MIYLANGISTQMFDFPEENFTVVPRITRISGWDAGDILRSGPFVSVYGHSDTARLLAAYFRMEIPVSRERITLTKDDTLVVVSSQRARNREIGYDRKNRPTFRFYKVRLA